SLADLDAPDDDPQQPPTVVLIVPAHLDQGRPHPGIGAERLDYPPAYQRLEIMGRQPWRTARVLLALLQQRLAYVVAVTAAGVVGVHRAHAVARIIEHQSLEQ